MKKIVLAAAALLVLLVGGCGVSLVVGSSMLTTWSGAAQQAELDAQQSQGFGLSSKVPAQYVQWVMKAGQICPSVTPPMIAAQIEAESSWNPDAVGPAIPGTQDRAVGIAQFMPVNFALIRDEDGNGSASPTDPADEIVAQGRLMCQYAALLSPAYTGEELQRLTLAAYNIGPYKVLAAGCTKAAPPACPATMPSDPSVRAYVDKIMSTMGSYAAVPATLGAGGVGGPWQQPVTSWGDSGTFHQLGSHWHMCGWHTGYDYVVPTGTPVRAIHDGTVIHAGYGGDSGGTGPAYGNQVIVSHGVIGGKETRSYYDHFSAVAVSVGQKVTTGQVVGMSGATGNVTGPHLHLEMTIGATGMPTCDTFVDPHAYIVAHATDPVTAVANNASTLLSNDSSAGAKAVAAAKSQLGVAYSYGGGGLNGPTSNVGGTVGFDCSSLMRFAWYQATGGKVTIDRVTEDQVAHLTPITEAHAQPGDLVFFQISPGDWDHVGMYLGPGQMIHAPHPGDVVRIAPFNDSYYSAKPKAFRRVNG